MKRNKICYKICYKRGNKYTSLCILNSLAVNYSIGEKCKPAAIGTPIFAYESLEYVTRYMHTDSILSCGTIVVFECLYTDLYDLYGKPKFIMNTNMVDALSKNRLSEVWKLEREKHNKDMFCISAPDGTILVKSITPIRVLEKNEY